MSPSFITILPTSSTILSAIAAILRDPTRPPFYAAGAALVASRDHFYYRRLLLIVAELERYITYIAPSWLPRDDAIAAFARYVLYPRLESELPIDQPVDQPVNQPVDLRLNIPSVPVEFPVDTGASISVYNPASNVFGPTTRYINGVAYALHGNDWLEIVD